MDGVASIVRVSGWPKQELDGIEPPAPYQIGSELEDGVALVLAVVVGDESEVASIPRITISRTPLGPFECMIQRGAETIPALSVPPLDGVYVGLVSLPDVVDVEGDESHLCGREVLGRPVAEAGCTPPRGIVVHEHLPASRLPPHLCLRGLFELVPPFRLSFVELEQL